jgi:hypothetical protein
MSRLLAVSESYRMLGRDHRANESCTAGQSAEVQKCLREFRKDVDEWGKDGIYPDRAIFVWGHRLPTQEDKTAFLRGIREIMGGHPGCTRPNDGGGETLMQMFARLTHEIQAGKA